jgi:hypothetical protein
MIDAEFERELADSLSFAVINVIRRYASQIVAAKRAEQEGANVAVQDPPTDSE